MISYSKFLCGALGAAAILAFTPMPASAAPETLFFNTPSGNLGTSHTYSAFGGTITAFGFTNSRASTADLYGKNQLGNPDEQGLGIAGHLDNEITAGTRDSIVLDLLNVLGGPARLVNLDLGMASVSGIDAFQIWEGNTLATLSLKVSGTTSGVYDLVDGFRYIEIRAVGAADSNVLLHSLRAEVPEPASLALLGSGLLGLAGLLRSRRKS